MAVTAAITIGIVKFRLMLSVEVLRHASSGPIPVRKSSSMAMGMFTRLKKGGPTVTLFPCTASESTGNNVPHSTVKHEASSSRLLNRKLDSRETRDSSLCSLFRYERFLMNQNVHTTTVSARKPVNQSPMD